MSGTALALRPYQRDSIAAARASWEKGILRPAIVIPTGGGKTVVVSHIIEQECARGGRVLFLAHREELIDQGAEKIRTVAPGLRVGIEMANRRADLSCDAVVASVPTLASARRRQKWPRDHFTVVIVDECHHALADSYTAVLDHFGCYGTPGTRTLGVTATLARGDGAGLGTVWQEVAFECSLLEMIADGYLVVPRGRRVEVDIDFSQVRSRGGDYVASDLGEALSEAGFEKAVARAYDEHGQGRPGLVFTPTVATAHSAAAALREAGYKAEAVWGEMDRTARAAAVEGLRNGELDILTNCAVLTEGTDIPRAAVAVMARPTKSGVLYRQMAGRVLRPFPGKTEALVLDLVGSTADHRLCTLIDLADGEIKAKPKKKPDEEPEEVLDDETLVEAVDRVEKAKTGKLRAKATDVNLFGSRESVWLQTHAGYWFVPAGGGQIFLREVPGDRGWNIGWMPREGAPTPLAGAPDLELAMALGEEKAERAERAANRTFVAGKRDARWRSRRPSEKAIESAGKWGVAVPPEATAGEVSDLISVEIASARIDRYFAARNRGAA